MRNRLSITLLGALGICLLAGCAANQTYREGQQLIAKDDLQAGLGKLQEAIAAEPTNPEYKAAYLQARHKSAAAQLLKAAAAVATGQPGLASQHYQKALDIEPGNHQARNGLASLAREAKASALLDEARLALSQSDLALARPKVQAILNDNPRHEKALAMLREIDTKSMPVLAEPQLAGNFKKPISIDFKDATLKQVFELIARSSGLNILFDKDVKADQKVSMALKDSSIEAALYYLLLTHQLEQQVMDSNTILIFPNNAAKLKDYQQTMVKTFVLSNANAKAVAEMLKTVVKSRDIVVDEKLNMVILRDVPEAIRLAEKLVALQDMAEPEVMLEVEILEIGRDRLMELGVAWPGGIALTPLSAVSGNALTVADLRSLSRETLGATFDPIKLNARKMDSDNNILANPRIRVLNREKAKIMIGNKVPSITTSVIATGIVTESVTYLDVGLKLEVEPIIYVDNDIAIKLALEVSNIVATQKTDKGTLTYTIGTRSANTTLRLKDGENQILAGLINDEDRRSANKLPGLGDIPIAGRLFGSTLDDGKKTEIVLSITPRLIRNVQRLDAAASEFVAGTENSPRRRSYPAVGPGLTTPSSTTRTAP